jgi:hypothetical protein
MTRFDAPSRITVKPQNNVYTALALISALATLTALVVAFLRYRDLIG